MNAISKLVAVTVFGGLSLVASSAAAKPNFPGQITVHLNLNYTAPCSICHIDGVTGGQTVVTPFGYSMVSHGLSGGKTGVDTALENMKASGVDSDGDGVSDVDELIRGTDPNSTANGNLAGETPSAGCAVSTGPSTGRSDGAALLAAAGLALSLFVTRRRTSAQKVR